MLSVHVVDSPIATKRLNQSIHVLADKNFLGSLICLFDFKTAQILSFIVFLYLYLSELLVLMSDKLVILVKISLNEVEVVLAEYN